LEVALCRQETSIYKFGPEKACRNTWRGVKVTLREILEKTDKDVEGLRLWCSSKRVFMCTGVELNDYSTIL